MRGSRDIAGPATGIFLDDESKRTNAGRATGNVDLIIAGLVNIGRPDRARLRNARLIGDVVHAGAHDVPIDSGMIACDRLVDDQVIVRPTLRQNARIALPESQRSHRKRQHRRTHTQ